MKVVAVILILILGDVVFAVEKSETFVIDAYDKSFKIVSPQKYSRELSAIINNKGHVRLLGKIQTAGGKVVKFVSIESNKFDTVPLKLLNRERLFFVPMSPAFQSFELVLGRHSYAIPAEE